MIVQQAMMENSLWGEHELDYVVVTRNISLERLRPNASEVCDVKAVSKEELAEWVASGSKLSTKKISYIVITVYSRTFIVFTMVSSLSSITVLVRLVVQY